LGQNVIEFSRALADEVGENLPLFLAAEVRARRRGRQVELRRIARMLSHLTLGPVGMPPDFPRLPGRLPEKAGTLKAIGVLLPSEGHDYLCCDSEIVTPPEIGKKAGHGDARRY